MNFHRITLPNLAALLLTMSVAGGTWAQAGTKDPAATQQVTKAMDSLYRQGAFEEAEARLLGTLKACAEQCSAPVKARIWMYIGIVRVDGRHKPAQAKQAFDEAVKLDPAVQLDRTVATPAAAGLFAKAGGNSHEATPAQPAPGALLQLPSLRRYATRMLIAKGIECAWTVTVLGVPQRPIAKRTLIVQATPSAKTRSVSHPGLDLLLHPPRRCNPLRARRQS